MARSKPRKPAPGRRPESSGAPGFGAWVGLAAAWVVLGLFLYAPALDGEFISDDLHYVAQNPYVQNPTAANLLAILDPTSVVPAMVENYAPVHLLVHALEWQLFGPRTRGYHVVNVLLHVGACLLLALLLQRTGVSFWAAGLGATLFLVHPANVEAVAWISQAKSSLALALALGALLAHPRRPVLGVVLFALALLAKPSAAFALPMLVLLAWARTAEAEARRPAGWGWIGAWALVLAVFFAVEISAFRGTAGQVGSLYAGPAEQLRSAVAIAGRYLGMAATGMGLSTFHEPAPARSWLDPWFVGGLLAFGLLGWRAVWAVRRRSPEAAWWAGAVAGWAPVSGVFALPYPMADRYLYFIAPGLVGGGLWLARDVGARLAERRAALPGRASRPLAPLAARGAVVAALALGVLFAATTHARARVWRTTQRVMADAVRNYPDGTAAHLAAAGRSARVGDAAGAVLHLRAAWARGYNRLDHLLGPNYAAVRGDPRFRALLEEMAGQMLEGLERLEEPSQLELRVMALAHEVRGERERALRALERALEVGGPVDEEIRRELRQLRARP